VIRKGNRGDKYGQGVLMHLWKYNSEAPHFVKLIYPIKFKYLRGTFGYFDLYLYAVKLHFNFKFTYLTKVVNVFLIIR
jgi:hypothetical protein